MAEIWFGDHHLTKGQKTQLRVIQSAIELFGSLGFQSVTLQQIAKLSDTSHPLILRHFGSKDALLAEVRRYVSWHNHEWVDGRVAEVLGGAQKLLTHCHENLNWGFHNPNEAKIILLTYYFNSISEEGQGRRAILKGIDRIYLHLNQASKEGRTQKGPLHLRHQAESIHAFTVGLFTQMLTFKSRDEKKLDPLYKKKLRLFLQDFVDLSL